MHSTRNGEGLPAGQGELVLVTVKQYLAVADDVLRKLFLSYLRASGLTGVNTQPAASSSGRTSVTLAFSEGGLCSTGRKYDS
jgi:hypothetical protein